MTFSEWLQAKQLSWGLMRLRINDQMAERDRKRSEEKESEVSQCVKTVS